MVNISRRNIDSISHSCEEICYNIYISNHIIEIKKKMTVTNVPNTVYRQGILRNIDLPSGYFHNDDLFWLQNKYTTGGVLITNSGSPVYYASKSDAERYTGVQFTQVKEYKIVP